MSDGVTRLTARLRAMREVEEWEVPETVPECAVVIKDLERRVIELEAFRNKPIVALVSAVMIAVAAKLAGAV